MKWIRQQKALMPDKPFFTYFAPGATHAPHHVPKEWADKYGGKFNQCWDKLREETFARQKKLGVIPQNCQLQLHRHPRVDETAPEMRPVLARQMEVYTGFVSYADHYIGKLVATLREFENPGRHVDLRDRVGVGGDDRRRSRCALPLHTGAAADGLQRDGGPRGLDGRPNAARRDYQDRERASSGRSISAGPCWSA